MTEWLDYRRDAGLWSFLLLPPLLSVAWAYGGTVGLGIVVAFGLGVALLALVATLCGVALWIFGKATGDAVRTIAREMPTLKKVRVCTPATVR